MLEIGWPPVYDCRQKVSVYDQFGDRYSTCNSYVLFLSNLR